LLAACCLLLWVGTAVARDGIVRSSLARPDRTPEPWLLAGPSIGGSPDGDPLTLGASVAVLLPPAAASELFTPCHDWNSGIVLRGEYRDIAPHRNLVVLDCGLRRFVDDADRDDGRPLLFAGVAAGIALASYPVGGGTSVDSTGATVTVPPRHAEERFFTASVEFGYQWRPLPKVLLSVSAQWRSYIHRPRDYSGWSVHLLAGVPVPW